MVRNVCAAALVPPRAAVGSRDERVEVADGDKAAVLRPYLRRWKWEVGQFFDGLDAGATDDAMPAAGPKHPNFRLVAVTATFCTAATIVTWRAAAGVPAARLGLEGEGRLGVGPRAVEVPPGVHAKTGQPALVDVEVDL